MTDTFRKMVLFVTIMDGIAVIKLHLELVSRLKFD
jgi:hypothetical protein